MFFVVLVFSQPAYFGLLNNASGLEPSTFAFLIILIVYVGDLSGPVLPQVPLEKVGGFAPPPFPVCFAEGGGRLDDVRPGGIIKQPKILLRHREYSQLPFQLCCPLPKIPKP